MQRAQDSAQAAASIQQRVQLTRADRFAGQRCWRALTCAQARYLRYESDRKVAGHEAAQLPMALITSPRTRSSTSLQDIKCRHASVSG